MTTSKRHLLSKGKGYLNAAGPQARFIVFLFGVLITYTFILLIFRKLAEILQLPLFFPLALVILVIFISIVGTLYSHKFIGPLSRIRKTIDLLADGDISVCLRVRESDDPVLKDLVSSISRLCEHSRNSSVLIQDAASDLSKAITELRDKIRRGAGGEEIRSQIETVRQKQETLERVVSPARKA